MKQKFSFKTGKALITASLASGLSMQPALAEISYPPNGSTTSTALGEFDITVNQDINLGGISLNAGDILQTPILEDTNAQISTTLDSNPNVVDTVINNLDLGGQSAYSSNYQVYDAGAWTNTGISGAGTNVYAGDIANLVNGGEYVGTPSSLGTITSNYGNGTFPATSQFGQYVDISLPNLPAGDYLYNINPLNVSANTNGSNPANDSNIVNGNANTNVFPAISDTGINPFTSTAASEVYLYDAANNQSIDIGTISTAQEAFYSNHGQVDFSSFQTSYPSAGPAFDYMTTGAGTYISYSNPSLGITSPLSIDLQGVPIGTTGGINYGQADTIVERLDSAIPNAVGTTFSTAIQVQTVQLQSTQEFTINGQTGYVYAVLDRQDAQPGDPAANVNGTLLDPNTMAITAVHTDTSGQVTGGTYDAYLNFNVSLYFGGKIVDTLQNGQVVATDPTGFAIPGSVDINIQGGNIDWATKSCTSSGSCVGGTNTEHFFPGVDPTTNQISVNNDASYYSFSHDEHHIVYSDPAPTPEADEWLMMLSGLSLLGLWTKSQKSSATKTIAA